MLDRLRIFAVVVGVVTLFGGFVVTCVWAFFSIVMWEILPPPPLEFFRFFIGIGVLVGVPTAIFAKAPDHA